MNVPRMHMALIDPTFLLMVQANTYRPGVYEETLLCFEQVCLSCCLAGAAMLCFTRSVVERMLLLFTP